MDIELPDIDGYEVTRRIHFNERNKKDHIPIIFLVAYIDAKNKGCRIDTGMNDVIAKSFTKEKAKSVLDAFIFHESRIKELE
jgi:CheY-like chemotaxis protein